MEHTVPQKKADAPVHGSALEHHPHIGPLLGLLMIGLVVIFAGLYLWGAVLWRESHAPQFTPRTLPNNEPETTRAVADTDILMTTSSSNELDALYADLESTNLDTLDAELDQILYEMGPAEE